jgi:hypothetical protein
MTNALQAKQLGLFKRTSLALCIVTLALLGAVRAQEVGVANVKLSSTVIKANNEALTFQGAATIFSDTAMLCPPSHKKGCTIRIVVSCQIWNESFNVPDPAVALVVTTSSGLAVYPESAVGVDNSSAVSWPTNGRTFQWMVLGVPPGLKEVISINAGVGGRAEVGDRTATFELFLN